MRAYAIKGKGKTIWQNMPLNKYNKLIAEQAVKITELQTKLDMYNGEH